MIKRLLNSLFKRLFKCGKKRFMAVCAVLLVVALGLTVYQTISVSYIDSMIVTLNYEGAKKGLNPDGSRFSISDIKSDEVLKSAINILGDNSLSVEGIKKRINIESKMPLSAIEKTKTSIASGSEYSYNPSEFDVYYSQKVKLGKNNTVAFLEALSEAYKEYFLNKYSDKNNILEFDASYTEGDYEYYEIYQHLSDKVSSMISYLGAHQQENPTFRSLQTGYSFENLVNMLGNLRDQDLQKLNSYIVQNQIANNKSDFIRKQQYLTEKHEEKYQTNIQASEISRNALLEYDPKITGVAFIPSVDQYNEYYMSRTKTGLDNIVQRSYNDGITANGFKKSADEHRYLMTKFSEEKLVNGTNVEADEMISELCSYLDKISVIAKKTDDEYVSDKTKDYITFNLPQKRFPLPVKGLVKNFVICFVIWYICKRAFEFLMKFYRSKRETIESKLKTVIEDE